MSYTHILEYLTQETRPASKHDRRASKRNAEARKRIERRRDQQRLRVEITEIW